VRPRSEFASYEAELIHSWSRTLTLLGIGLIPIFFALDTVTMPATLLPRFGVYRAVATAIAVAQYFLLRLSKPNPRSFLHGYFFSTIVAAMIVRMTIDLGGFDSAYYAGLILVIVAVNLVIPWAPIHSTINGGLVLAMYIVSDALFGEKSSAALVINNIYFLSSTLIIVVAISFNRHRLLKKEFVARAELVEANDHLEASRRQLQQARDALWGEMEVAKRIQTALLPANRTLGGYEIAALMLPALEVGGDYYDILETRHGEHWVAIGDVSGHGVESGLVMMMTQTSIATLVNDRPSLAPSVVFAGINRVIRENIARLNANRYMTLNVIRLRDDRLTVAGKHQDLLVLRANGTVEAITNDGSWVGILPDTTGVVGDTDVPIGVGDTVLLFTDGVTEATSAAGKMFGQEALIDELTRTGKQPLEQAMNAILKAVTQFEERQDDDITLVMLRRLR
jgi:phosphoserine phosphatase RsbU/P